jgi:pyochelin biosynthetic protein PchG
LNPGLGRPKRVVVCGTKFGRAYLAAFDRHTRSFPGFELVGILARGSDRSRATAAYYEAPLFTDVAQLPEAVDVACVVVGSAVNGGRGAELAQALLGRGIHVLQEHPLHPAELGQCLRAAQRAGVMYRMNTHYVHVPQVAAFLRIARGLLRRQRPLFIDAACSFQVAYTLLEIIALAIGAVRPWAFAPVPELSAEGVAAGDLPFRSVDGIFAGVPITLRVQNQLDPSDPDNHAHLFHRLTIGTEGGQLTLLNTYGPVVWCPRPYMPLDMRETPRMELSTAEHFEWPSAGTIGPAQAPSYREILAHAWPEAVRAGLRELCAASQAGEDPRVRGQLQLSLSQMWSEIAARLGAVQLVSRSAPEVLSTATVESWAEPEVL